MNAFNSFQMDFFVLSQLWTDRGSFFAFWFHAGSIQPIDVVLNYIWYRLVEQARLSRSALYLTFYFYYFPQLFPLDRDTVSLNHTRTKNAGALFFFLCFGMRNVWMEHSDLILYCYWIVIKRRSFYIKLN